MAKILFLGTHGQKNWGDELLLSVFMHQLKPFADHTYVNSYDTTETTEFLSDYPITVFNTQADRNKLLKYLVSSDILIFGGGSIIKELNEDYGGKRYATLNTLNLLTMAASTIRKPIYFANIGVGPINTDKGLSIANKILRRANHITLRDSTSDSILSATDLNNYKLTTDAVFSITPSFFKLKKVTKNKHLTIGINLCRNIDNNENWSYFISTLKDNLIDFAKKNPKVEYIGIPMQSDVKNNNDFAAIAQLEESIRSEHPEIKFTTIKTESISHMANLINSCDLLIAERLHSLITAVIINTPIIALAYNPKVLAIVKDIGLDSYCVDINRKFSHNDIIDAMNNCIKNKKIHNELAEIYDKQHKIATKGFDELFQAINKTNS